MNYLLTIKSESIGFSFISYYISTLTDYEPKMLHLMLKSRITEYYQFHYTYWSVSFTTDMACVPLKRGGEHTPYESTQKDMDIQTQKYFRWSSVYALFSVLCVWRSARA